MAHGYFIPRLETKFHSKRRKKHFPISLNKRYVDFYNNHVKSLQRELSRGFRYDDLVVLDTKKFSVWMTESELAPSFVCAGGDVYVYKRNSRGVAERPDDAENDAIADSTNKDEATDTGLESDINNNNDNNNDSDTETDTETGTDTSADSDLGEVPLDAVFWSTAEKELFFTCLSRFSIHDIDSIQRTMRTKSKEEILAYYRVLKSGYDSMLQATESGQRTRHFSQAEFPIAYEMSEEFVKYEDFQAAELAKYENRLAYNWSNEINDYLDSEDGDEDGDEDEDEDGSEDSVDVADSGYESNHESDSYMQREEEREQRQVQQSGAEQESAQDENFEDISAKTFFRSETFEALSNVFNGVNVMPIEQLTRDDQTFCKFFYDKKNLLKIEAPKATWYTKETFFQLAKSYLETLMVRIIENKVDRTRRKDKVELAEFVVRIQDVMTAVQKDHTNFDKLVNLNSQNHTYPVSLFSYFSDIATRAGQGTVEESKSFRDLHKASEQGRLWYETVRQKNDFNLTNNPVEIKKQLTDLQLAQKIKLILEDDIDSYHEAPEIESESESESSHRNKKRKVSPIDSDTSDTENIADIMDMEGAKRVSKPGIEKGSIAKLYKGLYFPEKWLSEDTNEDLYKTITRKLQKQDRKYSAKHEKICLKFFLGATFDSPFGTEPDSDIKEVEAKYMSAAQDYFEATKRRRYADQAKLSEYLKDSILRDFEKFLKNEQSEFEDIYDDPEFETDPNKRYYIVKMEYLKNARNDAHALRMKDEIMKWRKMHIKDEDNTGDWQNESLAKRHFKEYYKYAISAEQNAEKELISAYHRAVDELASETIDQLERF